MSVDLVIIPSITVRYFRNPVKAGFPSPADDYREERIDLSMAFIPHPSSTCLVENHDDAMIGAFVPGGARLLVDRALQPKNGDIVRAVVNGEFVVRYLRKNDFKCWLVPANKKYRDIEITVDVNFTVWGVVTRIFIDPMKLGVSRTSHDVELVDLNREFISDPLYCFLIDSEGDSLIDAFVPRKAKLIVDRSVRAKSGHLILAILNNEFTVKFFKKTDMKCWLEPANPKYKPTEIKGEMDFQVWGVVTTIIIDPNDTRCML